MKKDNFVNLHLHTEASLQDSIITIPSLYNQVNEYHQEAVAVTDHGSCAAWTEFDDFFNKKGNIKPIFGAEFYCTSHFIQDINKRRRDHLVMLAMDNEGLINIRRIQKLSQAYHYYKPLVFYDEVLNEFPVNGIFATSACSLSTISNCILENDMKSARQYAEYFYDLFDGNFALELQPHYEYKDQYIINEGVTKLSEQLDFPIIVTCDSHFCNEEENFGDNNKEENELRKIIKAITYHKQISDPSLFNSLKSNCIGNSELIREFFALSNFEHQDVIDIAINNTNYIAKMCNAKLDEAERHIPNFVHHKETVELHHSADW